MTRNLNVGIRNYDTTSNPFQAKRSPASPFGCSVSGSASNIASGSSPQTPFVLRGQQKNRANDYNRLFLLKIGLESAIWNENYHLRARPYLYQRFWKSPFGTSTTSSELALPKYILGALLWDEQYGFETISTTSR